jgi:hypothetical protein
VLESLIYLLGLVTAAAFTQLDSSGLEDLFGSCHS